MEQLYVLRHRERGPLGTFTKPVEAGLEMLRLLLDEPGSAGDLWIEPFERRPPRPVAEGRAQSRA
jgi:hypothetical protein